MRDKKFDTRVRMTVMISPELDARLREIAEAKMWTLNTTYAALLAIGADNLKTEKLTRKGA